MTYKKASEGMADDTMRRRRSLVARAFADRRSELGLTQEKVAQLADVSLRTVLNFESQGRWPHIHTRYRLEKAVGWQPGEIDRLASEPEHGISDELREQIRSEFSEPTARRMLAAIDRILSDEEPPEGAIRALLHG